MENTGFILLMSSYRKAGYRFEIFVRKMDKRVIAIFVAEAADYSIIK